MTRRPSDAERLDLLLRVWELRHAFDFPGIRALLEPLGMARVVQDPELVLPLLSAYANHGLTRRGRRLVAAARPLFDAAPDRLRLRFMNMEANLLLLEGRVEEARPLVREYQAASDAASDDRHRLNAYVHAFMIAGNAADWMDVVRWLQRGFPLTLTALAGRGHLPLWHHNMAMACRHLGLFAEAQRHHDEAARVQRPDWVAAHNQTERALLAGAMGDHDLARALALRGLELHTRVASHLGMAEAYCALGAIALSAGELPEARAALQRAREVLDEPSLIVRGQIEEETAVLELLSGNARASRTAENRAARLYARMDAPRRALVLRLRMAALRAGARPDPVLLAEQAGALLEERTAAAKVR